MTTFTITADGFEELNQELNDLLVELPAAISRTANFVSQSTVQRVKHKIRTGGRSGRTYQLPEGVHTSSAPGEPPANFSGALANSYTFTKMTPTNLRSQVGSTLSYAAVLERGGFVRTSAQFGSRLVYIEPRPVLFPSFIEAINAARGKLKKEVEKVL